jgi:cytochrome c553
MISALAMLTACGEKSAPEPVAAPQAMAPAATPAATAPAMEAAPPSATAAPAISPGKLKYAGVCLGCHGREGAGQGPFPKLAGKSAAELTAKLKDYRAGKRVGPQSDTMMPFAKPLTDAEIDALAGYLAAL